MVHFLVTTRLNLKTSYLKVLDPDKKVLDLDKFNIHCIEWYMNNLIHQSVYIPREHPAPLQSHNLFLYCKGLCSDIYAYKAWRTILNSNKIRYTLDVPDYQQNPPRNVCYTVITRLRMATIKYSIAMVSGISLSMSNEGEIDWNNTVHGLLVVTWQCFPWTVLPRNHILYIAIYHDMYISHDLTHVQVYIFQAKWNQLYTIFV